MFCPSALRTFCFVCWKFQTAPLVLVACSHVAARFTRQTKNRNQTRYLKRKMCWNPQLVRSMIQPPVWGAFGNLDQFVVAEPALLKTHTSECTNNTSTVDDLLDECLDSPDLEMGLADVAELCVFSVDN